MIIFVGTIGPVALCFIILVAIVKGAFEGDKNAATLLGWFVLGVVGFVCFCGFMIDADKRQEAWKKEQRQRSDKAVAAKLYERYGPTIDEYAEHLRANSKTERSPGLRIIGDAPTSR